MMKEKTTYDLNMRWYWYLLGRGDQFGNMEMGLRRVLLLSAILLFLSILL